MNKCLIAAAFVIGLAIAYSQISVAYAQTTGQSCVTFANGTHTMSLCSAPGNDVTVSADGGTPVSVKGTPGPQGPAGPAGAQGPAGPAGSTVNLTSFNCASLSMTATGVSGTNCTFK